MVMSQQDPVGFFLRYDAGNGRRVGRYGRLPVHV